MCYKEYHDMYLDCQKNKGKYYMVSFDIINSRQMNEDERSEAQVELFRVLMFASNNNFDIRLRSGLVSLEPIVGDAIAVSCLSSNNENLIIFMDEMQKCLENKKIFVHRAEGYFDTFDWCKGNTEYYSGYLFSELTQQHKKQYE